MPNYDDAPHISQEASQKGLKEYISEPQKIKEFSRSIPKGIESLKWNKHTRHTIWSEASQKGLKGYVHDSNEELELDRSIPKGIERFRLAPLGCGGLRKKHPKRDWKFSVTIIFVFLRIFRSIPKGIESVTSHQLVRHRVAKHPKRDWKVLMPHLPHSFSLGSIPKGIERVNPLCCFARLTVCYPTRSIPKGIERVNPQLTVYCVFSSWSIPKGIESSTYLTIARSTLPWKHPKRDWKIYLEGLGKYFFDSMKHPKRDWKEISSFAPSESLSGRSIPKGIESYPSAWWNKSQ